MMKRRIKNNIDRFVSILICFLLIFSMILPNFCMVYANNGSTERRASFINFYQNSDETVLDMKNLSNQDYYAMYLFMSNWFEPGKTTFQDVYKAEGDFVTNFTHALRKDGNEKITSIVKGFGADTVEGFNRGNCTLYKKDGSILTGEDLIRIFTETVKYIDNTTEVIQDKAAGSKSAASITTRSANFRNDNSVVYFGGTKNIAFDFSEDAIRAAYQTVMAYNPDLFLTKEGLQSCKVLLLDSVGNLWGCTDTGIVQQKSGTVATMKITESNLNKIFLILPACLNPAAFTPNVENTKSQEELRMPLMNRFVLSSMITGAGKVDASNPGDTIQNFEDKYIPIYNLLAQYNDRKLLTVFGLKTMSPYTLKTDKISENKWSIEQRRQDMASFVHDFKEIGISKSKSKDGLSSVDAYAYIAFCMNLNYMGTYTKKDGDPDGVLDMHEGMWWWKQKAFTVFEDMKKPGSEDKYSDNEIISMQEKLLAYFFTPTL